MKGIILLFVALAFLVGCASPGPRTVAATTITDETGRYQLIRPETREGAVINIELWAKEGISTNEYVFMKRQLGEGRWIFAGVRP